MTFAVCFILVAVGAVLIVFGWRGIRVGQSPFCRKCRSQLAEEGFMTPARCSECGTVLVGSKSIYLGYRNRRPMIAWLGVLVLVLALGWAATLAYAKVRNIRWLPHMPSWWLTQVELSSSDESWKYYVLQELDVRIANNNLSKDQRTNLIDLGLERQSDLTRPWNQAWGDLIEQGIIDGLVTGDQLSQYARGTVAINSETDSTGHANLWFRVHRAGTKGRLRFGISWRIDYLIVDKEKLVAQRDVPAHRVYDGVVFVSLGKGHSVGPQLKGLLPDGVNPDVTECLIGVTLGWHESLMDNSQQVGVNEASTRGIGYLNLGPDPLNSGKMTLWQEECLVNRKNRVEVE